jgi:hypothetical protein
MNPMSIVELIAATKAVTAVAKDLSGQIKGLGSNNLSAGFGSITRAAEMLGSLLGTVITPVLAIFSAGLITVSDLLYKAGSDYLPAFVQKLIEATSAAVGFAA